MKLVMRIKINPENTPFTIQRAPSNQEMRYSKQKESREQGMKVMRLLRIASNMTVCIASYDINPKQDAIVKKKLIDCILY